VLAARPVALGLIEGVADAVASLIKLWSGCHSDIMSGRRKGLALAGYALSNISRPLLGLAGFLAGDSGVAQYRPRGQGLAQRTSNALIADARPYWISLKDGPKPGPSLTKIA